MSAAPILIAGAGRMGGAIIAGWRLAGAFAASDLIIRDPYPGDAAIAASADGVRAFRVDSEVTTSGPLMTGPIRLEGSVEEISVVNATVGPQRDAYFAYYYLAFPFNGSRSRALEVLLYRPGYQIVSIPARSWWRAMDGGRPEGVTWKEAPDLLTQKGAVDRVASGRQRMSASKGVLQFVAGEYARLADSPAASTPEMAEERAELLALAKACEEQADAKKP